MALGVVLSLAWGCGPGGGGGVPATAVVQAQRPRVERLGSVMRCRDAAEQLAWARRARAASAGSEADWSGVVEAYRAVRRFHPGERELGAEGAFRAAELLRARGQVDAALAEFCEARRLAPEHVLGRRAAVEAGHIERRRRRYKEALTHYVKVLSDPRTASKRRDRVRLECARVCDALGRSSEARAHRRAASASRDADIALRAYDERALRWVESGDLEAAAGVLEECRNRYSQRYRAATDDGQRIRARVARMRAQRALVEAIQRRRNASSKASDAAKQGSGLLDFQVIQDF